MAKEFRLQVFTQERKVIDEPVTTVVAPAVGGYVGVLADHAPMIAALGEGRLVVARGNSERELHIAGGFLEVANNVATVLADTLTETSAA